MKVLLANEPEAVRTGLATFLQQQSDIEVVGTVLDPIELLVAVEDTQADVVIVTLPDTGEMPGICSHLLHASQWRAALLPVQRLEHGKARQWLPSARRQGQEGHGWRSPACTHRTGLSPHHTRAAG